MNRPLIAVICPEMTSTVSEIARGISFEAQKNNTDTIFFSIFSETYDEDINRKYEESIYSLINFDMISGVIFLESEFWTKRLTDKIKNIIEEKCSVPVLGTNNNSTGKITSAGLNIYSGDGIYETVSHLIEHHKCTDIYFLSGPKNNKISEERINGYIRCMKAHRLTPDMKNIFYGDFWYDYPVKLADKISSGKLRKPQAIACANDVMACSLIQALASHSISVPEDILVTGYDGAEESILNSPSVTTFFPPFFEQGAEYFNILKRMLKKQKPMHPKKHHGIFSAGGSCGCLQTDNPMISLKKKNISERIQSTDRIFRSEMSEKCMTVDDRDSFITAVDQSTYLIPGYEHLFLCLKNNFSVSAFETKNEYPEKMTIMLDKIEFVKVCRNINFRTSLMLPILNSNRDFPDTYFFFPVQFAGKNFGYIAVTYKNKQEMPGKALEIWVRNISAALFRMVSYSALLPQSVKTNEEESEVQLTDIAPKWFFELILEMKKPKNFTAGISQMLLLSHVSKEHLSRTFRKYLGVTPTEFVNDLKLEYAAMLITDKMYEITDACFSAGFSNISHFYHQFRKKFGCSPKQYKTKITDAD